MPDEFPAEPVSGNIAFEPTEAEEKSMMAEAERRFPDMVNHPPHYTSDPSGVECITITRHRNFNVGNAIKYLWRAGLKRDAPRLDPFGMRQARAKQIEDLRKAIFYINDEIGRLEGADE